MEMKQNQGRATPQPTTTFTAQSAFNDFLLRLEHLKKSHPDWADPKNQNRPFKQSFIEFIHNLILRMPVPPEVTPLVNGDVLFRYKKTHAPRHKWQVMEITLDRRRNFSMVAKSRIGSQPPFRRANVAFPNTISDMVRSFYELDTVNTKEHPIRFRNATVNDYFYIAAMCQSTFGPHLEYHPRLISQLMHSCVVAEDPIYGIVSCAAIKQSENSEYNYEVSFLVTIPSYRGFDLAGRCLRKAMVPLLEANPNATFFGKGIIPDGKSTDVCRGIYKKAGFRQIKLIRGEKKYKCFDCDRCNIANGYCTFEDPTSVCTTALYHKVPSKLEKDMSQKA